MNPKKRKAEEDEDAFDMKQKELKNNESETSGREDNNLSSCGSGECGNSMDQQKSDNGGSSERAATSEDKVPKGIDESKDDIDESTKSNDKKLTKLDNKFSGTLLFSGGTNWDLIGRKELPKNAKDATGAKLWGPHTLSSLRGIKVVGAFSGCSAVHSVIVTENGQAFTWGRNDKSQLGLRDTKRRDSPTIVEALKDVFIVSASCGRGHTIFLSDQGIAYSCGDNKMGQCGVGNYPSSRSAEHPTVPVPTKLVFKGRPIAKVACGAEFSTVVDIRGGVYSFGCPEYGQLGHNSDGRYFVTSNKLSFSCEMVPRRIIAFIQKTREGHVTLCEDVQITNVACGINHSVAVDSKHRCFTWGFGGYGRLGHAEQRDEMVPRLLKTFDGPGRGVKQVFAGGTYSMAINMHDVLFFFGQHKRAGDAVMYPKAVPDIVGWKVRDASCSNTSIICLADDSVISWGPSPTYGELAYGDSRPKSSTTPQEVKTLDGIHIYSVSMGCGHALFIARDETEEDREKLNKLPEYAP